MHHSTLLFAPPKQGGILQSSGFLDLKSLMALGLTCKAHAFDELSLIQLIENEITRNHQVSSLEEAIDFLKRLYRLVYTVEANGVLDRVPRKPLLRHWLERGDNAVESLILTHEVLSAAAPYEVMLAKMLRATPQSCCFRVMNLRNDFGETVLHRTALSGNPDSIKAILAFYPKARHIQALDAKDRSDSTVLHCAAISGNSEAIQTVLNVYPESQRLNAVCTQDRSNRTALYYAERSGKPECVRVILDLYPNSQQQLQAMKEQDPYYTI